MYLQYISFELSLRSILHHIRVISDDKPRKLDAGSFTLLTNLAEIALRTLLKDAHVDTIELPLPADEDSPSQTKDDHLTKSSTERYCFLTRQFQRPS